MTKMIVAEISKNWADDSPLTGYSLSELFERVIVRNQDRGYTLHSWRLNRINDAKGVLNETVIAVFEKEE